MRVVFLGSGAFGLPTLDAIAASHEVPLVVSQPDRRAGRGRRETPTPIAARVLEDQESGTGGLAAAILHRTESVNEAEALAAIDAARPDALVVIAFGQKLGTRLLADRFAINLHASLLPRWRGAAPINRAMMAGDRVSGISVISLADRMDAGEVHALRETPIDPGETAGELHDRLAALGPEAVLEVLGRLEDGRTESVTQDEALVTQAAKLARKDATIDFSVPATTVRAMAHGLVPWPGCEVAVSIPEGESGPERLRIHRMVVDSKDVISDRPVGSVDEHGLVACGRGIVRLLEVQIAGGRVLTWDDFHRGRPLPEGTILRPVVGAAAR
ncbi:MAG: methionyl-tRNA formyltransferase [Planctomycetaceae bacterium]|nr:methionyl-tRNA formyltransferase [Planctomycetaceae bacterium]